MIQVTDGIFIKEAASPAEAALPIAGASALTGVGGTGLGYGLARLTSPSVESVDNLRKEEQYQTYKNAINELKYRIAEKKQRLQGI